MKIEVQGYAYKAGRQIEETHTQIYFFRISEIGPSLSLFSPSSFLLSTIWVKGMGLKSFVPRGQDGSKPRVIWCLIVVMHVIFLC
jgi:hypothetical protein